MYIGLTGKAGSGKDTVGKLLVSNYGFTRFAFADALKRAALPLFNLTEDQVTVYKNDFNHDWGTTNRDLLQRFGTEAMRNVFGENFWVDRLRVELENLPPERHVVLTDVRFDSEAAFIRDEGGCVIEIVGRAYDLKSAAGHASEAGVSPGLIDFQLTNDGNMVDLRQKVADLMDLIKES